MGPFADYGDRFSSEVQLFAAAGYVVLYMNPRGSTSYGEEFGNLIHHAYPSQDFDDLMSGVDAVIAAGYVDEDQLFVTGGSGGGVLTAWIVGHTDRFRAAVSAKPVINWYSFVLTADSYNFFHKYWFSAPPGRIPSSTSSARRCPTSATSRPRRCCSPARSTTARRCPSRSSSTRRSSCARSTPRWCGFPGPRTASPVARAS